MEDDYPILPTTHGFIKGIRRTAIYGESYYSFEKIPYAKPPLGDLRFRAPQPAEQWAGVLDCTDFAEKPMQKNQFTGQVEGSEDCLYLNVYVNKLQTDKPLPVMIYIYGGAFQNGEATRDLLSPDYFMQEDIILVTLNYRLGALGFLCLTDPDLKIPGNAGLKDQLGAMRWFKKNCINFNGDANNITLFGESAGGASTHYQLLTENTKGLFHKAIVMSGTVYNKWANIPQGDYAHRLAKLHGYMGENSEKAVLAYLMELQGNQLVDWELMTAEEKFNDISFVFGPTVEPYVCDDCIIPAVPETMLKCAWSGEIPLLIGGTSFEGLLRYPRVKANPQTISMLKDRPELVLPMEVRRGKSLEDIQKLGKDIIELHMEGADLSFDNVFKYLSIISFKGFWHGFHRSVLSRLAYATADTYLYRFDFDSPTFNLFRMKYCGPEVRGVAHADDLSYLFYSKQAWKLSQDSAEYKTIRRMVGIWTAFAKHSNPNGEQTKEVTWKPVTRLQPNVCLNISNTLEIVELPETDKLQFWNTLYKQEQLY